MISKELQQDIFKYLKQSAKTEKRKQLTEACRAKQQEELLNKAISEKEKEINKKLYEYKLQLLEQAKKYEEELINQELSQLLKRKAEVQAESQYFNEVLKQTNALKQNILKTGTLDFIKNKMEYFLDTKLQVVHLETNIYKTEKLNYSFEYNDTVVKRYCCSLLVPLDKADFYINNAKTFNEQQLKEQLKQDKVLLLKQQNIDIDGKDGKYQCFEHNIDFYGINLDHLAPNHRKVYEGVLWQAVEFAINQSLENNENQNSELER